MSEKYERGIADPHGNFIFELVIDNIAIGQFQEVSGIKNSTEIFEIQEGGVNGRVHKLPAQTRWENITLRWGSTFDTSMIQWREEFLHDSFAGRRNGSIIMRDHDMKEVRRYNFKAGWPVAYEGPNLNAQSAELAVEMLEIAHHGITIEIVDTGAGG
jgi:phage tail-like protein